MQKQIGRIVKEVPVRTLRGGGFAGESKKELVDKREGEGEEDGVV